MYPDILNLYGDIGNVLAINQRCLWRGISTNIENFTVDKEVDIKNGDIILMGGGSDNSQNIISKHFLKERENLIDFIEDEKVLLGICGSYQLFGSYVDANKEKIPCLEIFDIETISQKERLIGDIVIENNFNLEKNIVGFENHGGRTYHKYEPLGHVKVGYGNNGEDKKEGMVYKNFIASYLHGPLLPKNPELTDYIILNALKNKYDIKSLSLLDDSIENKAHNSMENRIIN
jgi:CobQ-like glutamine amidotransferase family enzyme